MSRLTSVWRKTGFTLLEMLTVLGIVALLLLILLPSLKAAREQSRAIVCSSNVRQLVLANMLYAQENRDKYCPGAANFIENLHRWHGTRDTIGEPFDPSRGPLVPYLGPEGIIKRCPSFRHFRGGADAFELGNGGYGYNNDYIGVKLLALGSGFLAIEDDETGVMSDYVRRPTQTLMFSDAAFVTDYGIIEYSFARARFIPTSPAFRYDPSIQFRHGKLANLAWCDGHVDRGARTFSWSSGLYQQVPARFDVGWFGSEDDNRYFDLE